MVAPWAQNEPAAQGFIVADREPPVEKVMAPEKAPRLHAGVTDNAPRVVAARLQAGVTVPPEPDANMQAGVTVMPTGVPATAHVVAQAAVPLMVKEPEAGAHANTGPAIKEAKSVGQEAPLIVNVPALAALNHTGAPAVSVPTAA